jgi:phage host-nuclease inhibitor protein Gam
MSRRKQAALAVPADRKEAVQLIAEYRATERQTLIDRIVADAAISELKRRLAALVAERDAEQKVRFAALKAWWEAGGKELAGKRRSAELAGTSLGVRLTPKAVKFGKGWTAVKVVKWLGSVTWDGFERFTRTKTELDKQSIIKAFNEAGVAFRFTNVLDVIQTDEFFIDTLLDEGAIRAELER